MTQIVERMSQVGTPATARDRLDHLAPCRERGLQREVGARKVRGAGFAHIGCVEFLEGDLHAPRLATETAVDHCELRNAVDVAEMLVQGTVNFHQLRESLKPFARRECNRALLLFSMGLCFHQFCSHGDSVGIVQSARRLNAARSHTCTYSSTDIFHSCPSPSMP